MTQGVNNNPGGYSYNYNNPAVNYSNYNPGNVPALSGFNYGGGMPGADGFGMSGDTAALLTGLNTTMLDVGQLYQEGMAAAQSAGTTTSTAAAEESGGGEDTQDGATEVLGGLWEIGGGIIDNAFVVDEVFTGVKDVLTGEKGVGEALVDTATDLLNPFDEFF